MALRRLWMQFVDTKASFPPLLIAITTTNSSTVLVYKVWIQKEIQPGSQVG